MENESLYIPLGLKVQSEIFDGYGREELFKTAISTLISGGIDFILFLISGNTVICVIFMLIAITGSIMMFTKDKTNLSVANQLKNMVKFSKSQKVFKYSYLDEWNYL